MAQAGYTPIQLYYSTTAAAVPTAGNLNSGELAINITDGKLYYKSNAGVVTLLAGATGGGPAGGSNTQVQFNSSGILAGSANMTFNGTTLTAGGLTTTGTTSTGVLSVTGNTTLGDAAADSVTVNGTITSNLIFTDNTYDIGASGATRPRSLFLGSNITAGGSINAGNVITSSGFTAPASGTSAELGYNGTSAVLRGYNRTGSAYVNLLLNDNITVTSGGTTGQVSIGGTTFIDNNARLTLTGAAGDTNGLSIYENSTGNGARLRLTQQVGSIDYNATFSTGGNYHNFKIGNIISAYIDVNGVNVVPSTTAFLTGSLGSRLWTPGLAIGSGYSGVYGPALTYLATRSGSTWVSDGGGTATALTLDEGSFQVLKSQGVGGPGTTLVWSPIISTTGQQVGIGRSAPSSFTDLSIAQNNTYAIGFDTAGATQNYSYRIDSTNSNAWTLGARTTSVDLYWIQPGGNAVYTQTGALRVHNGTTAQRSTVSAGAIRWNTSYPQLEVADGTNYHKIVTEPIVTSASGGTITTDGDYKVHTFTSSGTFTLTTISGATRVLVQVMVLGGGGGGGFYLGGGGGSGAMLETEVSMSASAYTVTVGAGGAAVNSGLTYSGNGGFSSITGSLVSLNANGGGAGGNGQINDAWGANGNATSNIGSGGGGGSPYGVTISNATVNVVLGGSAGWNGSGGACGTTYTGSFTFNGGGGGGGAQSAGVAPNIGNGPVGAGGYGGSARPSYITGSLVSYGGGGGGGYGSYLANQAIGGGSGAGYGVGSANSGPTLQATAGTANQGGGGGGGQAYSPYQQGGAGGSGIVIIRYKFQ